MTTPTEKEIGGQTYRIGRLSTFQQLHVSRKVGPLIPALLPAYLAIAKDGASPDHLDRLAGLIQPFTDAFAAMADADVEYVTGICLSVVHRQQASVTWAPVWAQQGQCLMFDDMGLDVVLPLVVQVITVNLGPFIRGLLTAQMQPTTAPA